MPYLMCKDKTGLNPLDKAISDKNIQFSTNLLELLIKGDKKGFLYSKFINPQLIELKKMGIDLKPFFNSVIPFHKIDENNEKFIQYHSNSE